MEIPPRLLISPVMFYPCNCTYPQTLVPLPPYSTQSKMESPLTKYDQDRSGSWDKEWVTARIIVVMWILKKLSSWHMHSPPARSKYWAPVCSRSTVGFFFCLHHIACSSTMGTRIRSINRHGVQNTLLLWQSRCRCLGGAEVNQHVKLILNNPPPCIIIYHSIFHPVIRPVP